MTTTSATGHAKNVTNFESLISLCTKYGTDYNPFNGDLAITELNILLTNSRTAIDTHLQYSILSRQANNNRRTAFNAMRKLSTQVVSMLGCSNASALTLQDAKDILNKIRGQKPKTKPATNAPDASNPAPKRISTTQLSYPQRIQHFAQLIALVALEPQYTPNEPHLQLATLNTFCNQLRSLHSAAIDASNALKLQRIHRNEILYTNENSLLNISREVKRYICSVYGADSPYTQQAQKIPFKLVA